MSTLLGTVVGRYQLEALLGCGGMAEVYRAIDTELGRTVAVKLVLPVIAAQPEFRLRFSREARLVAALEHPHIAPIYDVGEHQGLPYLVMPFYDGGSLANRLEGRPLPPAEVTRWLTELASALDAAHQKGVLHRDVKPSNVLLDQHGRALLADFGVALASEASTRLTTTGAVVGTPGYMAPEIALGQGATPATDRYSLAVLAYELLTGRLPFTGESAIAVLHQHATQPVPPLAERLPDSPPELDALLRSGLAKRPEDRPENALRFAEELGDILATMSPGDLRAASSTPTRRLDVAGSAPPPRAASRGGRSRWPARLGLVALVVAGALGGTVLWQQLESAEVEPPTASQPAPAQPSPESAEPTFQAPGELVSAPAEPSRDLPASEVATSAARPAAPARETPSPPPSSEVEVGEETEPLETSASLETTEPGAVEPSPSDLPTPGAWTPGGPRRLNTARPRDLLRGAQRLTAQDFRDMALRAATLSRRPMDVARAATLGTYAKGGLAYVEGRAEEAAQVLAELYLASNVFVQVANPGPLVWRVLRERPAGTPFEAWELALGYGDARKEGLAAANAAVAARPSDPRLLVGRAQLQRLDGNHAEALRDAEQALALDPSLSGPLALFVAEELVALNRHREALDWYRQAVSAGGRLAVTAALEGSRLAEELLGDRAAAIELLTSACRLGQPQACRRAERLRGGL